MNLLRKAAEFEQLCKQFAKKSQQITPGPFRFRTPIPEASLSGPTPTFQVNKRPEEVSVSVHDLPSAQKSVSVHELPDAAKAPQSQLPLEMLGILSRTLMNFDPTQFNGVSIDVDAVKAAGSKLNAAVANKQASGILQALSEVLGLTRNGGGQLYTMAYKLYNAVKATLQPKQPASWLSDYMKQEKLKDSADEKINEMQASLDAGNSVQDALNRSNKVQ
jgi:hypothetical protein